MTTQTPNVKKRPVHKANLLAAKVSADLNHKHPEPMSIIRKREKNVDMGIYSPGVSPTLGKQEKAGEAMAAWDNSDPFAFGRTVLYVRKGFLNADDVIKEMGQRAIARKVAKVREVDNAK